jgi:hypothetical protein
MPDSNLASRLLAPDKATQLLYLQIIKAILSFVSGEPGSRPEPPNAI